MKKYTDKIIQGDAAHLIKGLPDDYVDMIITSPPYFGCRVYGDEEIGREENPLNYVNHIAEITALLKDKLAEHGSFYLNMGDVYFGTKGFIRNKGSRARKTDSHYGDHKIVRPQKGGYLQYKQSLMLPERTAIKMQEQGWILRNKIIWEKPNPLPSYAPDRRYPVYEHIFHFVKARRYYFDLFLAKKKNHPRDVIKNGIEPFRDTHQSTFPLSLIEPFIQTTTKEGNLVLDPFMGSGTPAAAVVQHNRCSLEFELHEPFCHSGGKRIKEFKKDLQKEKLVSVRITPAAMKKGKVSRGGDTARKGLDHFSLILNVCAPARTCCSVAVVYKRSWQRLRLWLIGMREGQYCSVAVAYKRSWQRLRLWLIGMREGRIAY